MQLNRISAVVSGGASGLGLATARRLLDAGAQVTLFDLPTSDGEAVASALGPRAAFRAADVTDPDQVGDAFANLVFDAPLRAIVHTAGRGGPMRVLTKAGEPGSLEAFEAVLRVNVSGTFNVLSIGASQLARTEPEDEERGAIVLTSSVAAFEGQIGQLPYATSKAAIVGMTLCAARDLASRSIRVNTIAPGIFDTPLMAGLSVEVRDSLNKRVPNPRRMGRPDEFATLAVQMLENPYLNGETIRLDGAIRMPPA